MKFTGLFVTGTGTGVGKTFVTRAMARALAERQRVAALKPIETGCDPEPADAIALAAACGHPELAHDEAFYRAAEALSPRAVAMQGGSEPDLESLANRVHEIARDDHYDVVLVEGAGGLCVPLARAQTTVDFVSMLRFPLVLVSHDRLGVLSDVLSYARTARASHLTLLAVVLTRFGPPDPSTRSNSAILAQHLDCPIYSLPETRDHDDALARALRATHFLARFF